MIHTAAKATFSRLVRRCASQRFELPCCMTESAATFRCTPLPIFPAIVLG